MEYQYYKIIFLITSCIDSIYFGILEDVEQSAEIASLLEP